MGLGPSPIKLLLELRERGILANRNSCVEMGSQELHLPLNDFKELLAAAGISDYDETVFSNLAHWPQPPRCSAKAFYNLLGIENYSCIDLGGHHNAVKLDLNYPLEDRSLYGSFDIVTDFGANEHVFNVGEAYRTMHRLCKKEGLIIIVQMVRGINGYYGFDSTFFEGLAAANGYRILFCSYVLTVGTDQYNIPLSRELLRVVDWSRVDHIGICYVFEKKSEADFVYASEFICEQTGLVGFEFQFLPVPPSRSYVGLQRRPDAHLSGRELVRLLLQRIRRRVRGRLLGR